jgi:hypothetical protein
MAMQTREVPTHEWVPFLDDFSRRHQGEPVTVEVFDRELGAQREMRSMPLIGVSVDLKDGTEQIEVIAGDEPRSHLMHAIAKPARVHLASSEAGADQALQIESADGSTTLVRLDRPA